MGPQAGVVCSLFFLLQVLAVPAENPDFSLAGDYLLGGLFTLHANVKGTVHLNFLQVPKCKEYEVKALGYKLMQAVHFAVEEINNHSSLLPGVRLGYEMVDICYVSNNIQPVLYFLAQEDYFLPIQEDYSHYVPRVVAVIGPENSEATMTVAHFLSLFLLPQITFSAISDDLRNKQSFPAVLRTVPGADHHLEAMVQLMLRFGWNWIVVLVSDDDYGRRNSQLLSEHLARHDICVALHEVLPTPQPSQVVTRQERRRLEAIVDKLRHSSARVVVVFSPDLVLHHFFHQVLRQNLTGTVWIASESWAIDLALHNLTELSHTGTFLGITTESVSIPGFSEFRVRRAQARTPASNRSSWRVTCNQECDACLDALESFNTILTLSGERVAYSVYSAVYAVAHGLHSLLGCSQTHCPKEVVYPWRLLQEIRKVNFTLLGHHIFFDDHGDLPMPLEVIQWHWNRSQNPFQTIASYHPAQRQLKDVRGVSWHTPDGTVPVSTCSKDCQPGQKKKSVGIHPCCFECLDCPPGTFLNKTEAWPCAGPEDGGTGKWARLTELLGASCIDEFDCQPCPSNEWSHRGDTSCFKRQLTFLQWHNVPTIFVVLLAALGFLSTLAVLAIFWRHLQTPMVRSAGGPMCFLILTSLLVAYLMVPMYVGPPTPATCLCRQTFFTLCFTICISCIAVRSFQIVYVFKMARQLPRAYGYWVRYHGPYVFVAAITALKVAMVTTNQVITATGPTARADPRDPKIMILSCNPDYRKGLLVNTSLDLLLSVVGFSFAYMGKELPTSYNEAKFITFCMTFYFTSSVSLCTFMSVYEGVLVTFLDLLVTVLNLLGISLGYFGPKCYLILFHPERNTPAYFSSVIQGYTMGRE